MGRRKKKSQKKEIPRFDVKHDVGLTNFQCTKRELDGLVNHTEVSTSRTYKEILKKNLVTFFNILLLSIAIILICFGLWSSCAFIVILILNIGISLGNDIKAKIILDKISLMQEKDDVVVIRDGRELKVNSNELVLDDVYIVSKDIQIPCDSIVIHGECMINEALVTGESVPIKKVKGDKILSGSYCVNGVAHAKIDAIGKDNYIQQLQARAKQKKTPHSHVYRSLDKVFKLIATFVIVLGILEIILQSAISYQSKDASITIYEWLQTSVIGQVAGAIISMIPSGMYLLTSVALATGVITLFNQKVAVQDMYSIETAARVDVLCIDKTGTITDGQMEVSEVINYSKEANENLFRILISSYNVTSKEDNFTAKALRDKFGNELYYTEQETIQYNSINKYGAASFNMVGTICVGAFGFVPLSSGQTKVKRDVNKYSELGYRVLVVARSTSYIKNGDLPNDLFPIGLIILHDHIRENAKEIISWFQDNDVTVKVISGDNELTVKEISKIVGIKNAEKYVSLAGKTDKEVKKLAKQYNVFGRVSPEQKQIIVQALQEKKHKVAMFGDGINDLLGLKSANVSISINSATKAAKDISSMLIMDDDFARLTDIVDQGRRIINNLQRSCTLFLIKAIFAITLNIFFLMFGTIMWFALKTQATWPFTTNTFYAWEFVTIGIAGLLLTFEKNRERIKGSFTKNIFKKATLHAVILSLVVMGYYIFTTISGFSNNIAEIDKTIITYVISFASVIFLFIVCYPYSIYRIFVCVLSVLLVFFPFVFCIYSTPELNLLGLYPTEAPRYLELKEYSAILILISIVIILYVVYFSVQYIRQRILKRRTLLNERNGAANSK